MFFDLCEGCLAIFEELTLEAPYTTNTTFRSSVMLDSTRATIAVTNQSNLHQPARGKQHTANPAG